MVQTGIIVLETHAALLKQLSPHQAQLMPNILTYSCMWQINQDFNLMLMTF